MFKKILFVLFLLLLPLSVLGAEYHKNDEKIVASDRVIETNYYSIGDDISIYGTINGDIFIIAHKVLIDSENINGDLFIVSPDITINGKVNGNIRAIGEKLEINGEIEKNTFFIGSILNLSKESRLKGNLTNLGGNINILGSIEGEIEGYLNSISIDGNVNNVDINLIKSYKEEANFKIGENAIITGNIKYKALREAEVNEVAQIGNIEYIEDSFTREPLFTLDNLWKLLIQFFGLMVIGMILLHLFPNLFRSINKDLLKFSFKNIIKGLLFFILIPIVSILLLITIIGIPLSIISLILYIVFIYLSKLFIAYFYFYIIKNKFFKEKEISNNNKLAIGILLYLIVSNIPVLGSIINIYFFLLIWSMFFNKIINKFKK